MQFHPQRKNAGLRCHSFTSGRSSKPLTFEFAFTAERITRSTNRAVLEITIEGRPAAMHVPIVLLNGNLLL